MVFPTRTPPLLIFVIVPNPLATTFLTAISVAELGPSLFNVTVKVTTSPTVGNTLLIWLVNLKSAIKGIAVILDWSSSEEMLLFGVLSTSSSVAAVT